MVIIFIRASIILLLLVVVIRLMGKRQIGEMQPYEFVITLLIAEVACVPMSDVSIPLLYGIASIIAIFILHQILTLTESFGQSWKRVISGKPSIVVDSNGVNCAELKKNNLDVADLIESLRSTGTFALDEVKYAILEANGKLSVLKNQEIQPNEELPVLLIDSGKYIKQNIEMLNYTTENIDRFLKQNKVKSYKNVEVLTIDGTGKVYLQEKNKKFEVLSMQLTNGLNW